MAKKSKKTPSVPTSNLAAFQSEASILALYEHVESEYASGDNSYRRLYESVLEQYGPSGNDESSQLFQVLKKVDSFTLLEDAIRCAGFVIGFAYAMGLVRSASAGPDVKVGAR